MVPTVLALLVVVGFARAVPAIAAEPPPCAHASLAPLAHLAGDWSVRVQARLSGNPADWDTSEATARIERAIRDCAWIERYAGSRRGRPFEMLRVFAAAPDRPALRVAVADSDHGPLYTSGGVADSTGIAFFTHVATPGGEVHLRLRLFEIARDSFTVENHRSTDGGATWDRTGRAEYRRRTP